MKHQPWGESQPSDQMALDFTQPADAPGHPGQLSLWDVGLGRVASAPISAPAPAPAPASAPAPATPVTAPVPDASAQLDALRADALGCHRCGLRDTCKGVVFGEGDPRARVLLIGEGPGQVEDDTGRPFVGAAGQLLDRILEAVGLRREEVYIANVVKCRPPGNRIPTPAERAACRPWLDRQIELIAPAVMVCLGASSAQVILGDELRITQARGRWFDYNEIKVMPTFHPAAILRDPSKRRPVWEDFKKVKEALGS